MEAVMKMSAHSSRLPRLVSTLSLAIAGLLLVGCGRAEPEHQGKPLSQWVRALDIGDTFGFEKHNEAVDALVAIGQPAIPFLIKLLDDTEIGRRVGAATALLRIDPQVAVAQVRPRLA